MQFLKQVITIIVFIFLVNVVSENDFPQASKELLKCKHALTKRNNVGRILNKLIF